MNKPKKEEYIIKESLQEYYNLLKKDKINYMLLCITNTNTKKIEGYLMPINDILKYNGLFYGLRESKTNINRGCSNYKIGFKATTARKNFIIAHYKKMYDININTFENNFKIFNKKTGLNKGYYIEYIALKNTDKQNNNRLLYDGKISCYNVQCKASLISYKNGKNNGVSVSTIHKMNNNECRIAEQIDKKYNEVMQLYNSLK